jgi:hypothetical protein
MDSAQFITATERDARIAVAIQRALRAMVLTTGNAILIQGQTATLNFRVEIRRLHEALLLLGVDSTEHFPPDR